MEWKHKGRWWSTLYEWYPSLSLATHLPPATFCLLPQTQDPLNEIGLACDSPLESTPSWHGLPCQLWAGYPFPAFLQGCLLCAPATYLLMWGLLPGILLASEMSVPSELPTRLWGSPELLPLNYHFHTKQRSWPRVGNCPNWAMGSREIIILFSLLLCLFEIVHNKAIYIKCGRLSFPGSRLWDEI